MTTSTSSDGSKKAIRSDGDAQPAAEPAAPSAELLEFLGEFESEGGDWIDPLDFESATGAGELRDGDADD